MGAVQKCLRTTVLGFKSVGHNAVSMCRNSMCHGSGYHKFTTKHSYNSQRQGTACTEAKPVGIVLQLGQYGPMALQQCQPVVRPIGEVGGKEEQG